MKTWFESVTDLALGQETIRKRPYGVIEVAAGRLQRIVFRPWPKLFTADDVLIRSQFSSRRALRDACRLFFNQPRQHRNYLALKFIVSNLGTTFATIRHAMQVLDEIARIKRSDAIMAHVTTPHVSDRLMRRWGWEQHLQSTGQRHFIKRFYGVYAAPECSSEKRLKADSPG